MKTPPFKLINAALADPIRIYVHWRSHLYQIWTMNQISTVLDILVITPITITSEGGLIQSNIEKYTISFDTPTNLPGPDK